MFKSVEHKQKMSCQITTKIRLWPVRACVITLCLGSVSCGTAGETAWGLRPRQA